MKTITTAAALDELPVGSVVLDSTSWPWSRHGHATWTTWQHRLTAVEMVAGEYGPFAVLYVPDAPDEATPVLVQVRAYLQQHLDDPQVGGLGIRIDRLLSTR